LNPALSPEGGRVAFTWDGENQDNFDIYIKTVGSTAPLRLTRDSAGDVAPAWSPDGRMIAFLRLNPADRQEVFVIPSLGGAERKVGETLCKVLFQQPSIAWSADGRWLIVSHRPVDETRESLFLVSIQTGEKRRLTTPPAGARDYRPSLSPDGRRLVFVRMNATVAGSLHLMNVSRDLRPAGEPLPLTRGDRWLTSPVWARDGRRIAYVTGERHRARHEVRLISVSNPRTSDSIRLEPDLTELTLGLHLIYVRETQDSNIWRTEIRSPGRPPANPQRFISSTRYDYQPRYSPDGKKIAFLSTRSGSQEIWITGADGGNASQLSAFGGPLVGGLAWSPDGARLVCHVRLEGRASLFSVPVSGGAPRRLTTGTDDSTPSYSRDGRWIYFARRSERLEIWRMPAEGGHATPLLRSNGGGMPLESSDGKSLYYCHERAEEGIWKAPAQGGEGQRVTGPAAGPVCGLALGTDGIYYSPANSHSIHFVSFSTGSSRPVASSDRPIGHGLGISVSPDQRFLLFYRLDQSGSDLYMIENFVVPEL
jgi:Tol biopolymer transport system component